MDVEEAELFALVLDPVSGQCTPYNVPDSTTLLMAGPMFVVGFMSAGCSLLKQAETKYAFTQFTFTRMAPSFLSLEPIGCFVPCVSGIKSLRIGVFERLLHESDKWARVSVGSDSISTSPWVLSTSLWPLKRLLERFTF